MENRDPDNLKIRQEVFNGVFKAIAQTFPFKSKSELSDFKKKYLRYYKNLSRLSEDDRGFFVYLEKLLAGLHNSHTKLGSYPTKKFFAPKNYSVVILDNKFYLKRAGKVVGKILLIDGQKPEQILLEQIKRISGSTKQFLRYRASLFLLTKQDSEPAILKLKRGGKIIFLKLPRIKIEEKSMTNPVIAKILKGRIGYLQVKFWSGNISGELLDQKIGFFLKNKIKVLIIDVRGNPGGNSLVAGALVAHFFDKKVLFSITKTRISKDSLKVKTSWNFVEPAKPYVEVPIILLVDVVCFSSNEYFIAGLKDNKRAILIGEATGGGSGNSQKFRFPYKDSFFELLVSTWVFLRPNKIPLERKGIEPHMVVRPTLAGMKRNYDEVLARAVIEARKL